MFENLQDWPLGVRVFAAAALVAIVVLPFMLIAISKQLDRIITLLGRDRGNPGA